MVAVQYRRIVGIGKRPQQVPFKVSQIGIRTLLLSELPRIMPFHFDSVIREDSYAQIMCVVTEGDPPFSIAWSFHGHNITSNDLQIRTSNIGDRTSLLMIPNVSYKHMGNYTCKVTNKAGSLTHTATLKVNGKS